MKPLRLHEKGDKRRTIGLHFTAAQAIHLAKAELTSGPLFRPRLGPRSQQLGTRPLEASGLYLLIRARSKKSRSRAAVPFDAGFGVAAKISESLRQQFAETGLPETAQALTVAARQIKQAAGEFDRTAGQLTNSYGGAAENARRAIDQVRSSISTATNAAADATKRLSTEFSRDYKWSIFTLTGAALVLGLLLGFVLHWWMNPKAEEARQPAAPAAIQALPQTQNPLPPTKAPHKRPVSSAGKPEQ